jgi:hypothetical protein
MIFLASAAALCLGGGDLSNQRKKSEAHKSFHGIFFSPLNTNERYFRCALTNEANRRRPARSAAGEASGLSERLGGSA